MEKKRDAEQFLLDRGFGQRMGWGWHPALLVVDFSVGFTDPRSLIGADLTCEIAETVRVLEIAETVRVLEIARRARISIYFSTIAYDDAGARDACLWTAKIPDLGILRKEGTAVEIDPCLGRLEDEPVIVKRFASAFFDTGFADQLHATGVDTLIVMGCTTSGCVRATVVDAMQNGFRPMIAREAVGDRLPSAHQQSLIDMDAKYGDVVSVEKTLEYLSGFPLHSHGGA